VPENLFKVFQFKKWGHPEHPIAVKAPIRTEDMQMGMKSKEVALREITMQSISDVWVSKDLRNQRRDKIYLLTFSNMMANTSHTE
jgi:hypothetical protein